MKYLRFLLLTLPFLSGCTTIIDSNPYYQTDYNSECLYSGVTWSELIMCLQKDLDSEWEQNRITNDLISRN